MALVIWPVLWILAFLRLISLIDAMIVHLPYLALLFALFDRFYKQSLVLLGQNLGIADCCRDLRVLAVNVFE